jgi:hypothetical protein
LKTPDDILRKRYSAEEIAVRYISWLYRLIWTFHKDTNILLTPLVSSLSFRKSATKMLRLLMREYVLCIKLHELLELVNPQLIQCGIYTLLSWRRIMNIMEIASSPKTTTCHQDYTILFKISESHTSLGR